MNRIFSFLSGLLLAASSFFIQAQTLNTEPPFWIGSGANEVFLMVDFNDGSLQESWAFPFRFDGDLTAMDLISAVDSAYPEFSFNLAFGFLGDIHFASHVGLAGNPDYWNTFDYINENWVSNEGLTKSLNHGDWFGCSYTGVDSLWNPLFLPENFTFAPAPFTANSIPQTIGDGENEVVLVIDFNDNTTTDAYAWKCRFSGELTGLELLNRIVEADPALNYTLLGEFLNDIIYHEHAGLGANPNYWSSFSGSSQYDWAFNAGLSENLENNSWFGLSYTEYVDSKPLHLPQNIIAANFTIGISPENEHPTFSWYPNPTSESLTFENLKPGGTVDILDHSGRLSLSTPVVGNSLNIDLSQLPAGKYFIYRKQPHGTMVKPFIKL